MHRRSTIRNRFRANAGFTISLAFLSGVSALLMTGCAERQKTDNESAPSRLTVDATVIDSPDLPSLESTPDGDCLVTVQCRVERVLTGEAPSDPTFLATAWAFRDRIGQTGQELKAGALVRFTLDALDLKKANLETTMRINETNAPDAPEFWVHSMAIMKHGEHPHIEPATLGAPTEELSPIQRILVGQGEDFHVGEDGFCFGMATREFYRKDFWKLAETAASTGPGALDAARDFHDQLAARGIPLLIVVAPRASTIYADLATGLPYDWENDGPVNSPVEDWCQQLRAHGVHVLNVTPQFLANRYFTAADGKTYPHFLPNDSHWAPSGARLAANVTVDYIRDQQLVPSQSLPEEGSATSTEEAPLTYRGDLTELMKAGGIAQLTTETVAFPVDPAPSETGLSIQLLGDALTRIFSEQRSSYGDHLQAQIGADWNIIAPNGGVTTARKIFSRSGNLENVDLVIWEVTEEFLALHAMWRKLSLSSDGTLRLWRDDLPGTVSEQATEPVQRFEEQGAWDYLVGIRTQTAAELMWDGLETGDSARLTTQVRVGPADAGIKSRAMVTFRVLADSKELYRTALVPKRDRDVLSEPFTVPLPESGALKLTLITEVAPGTPPPWIDWVAPEVTGALPAN